MWEIIQLSHHDKLSDRLATQLQHNFNTSHTSFQHLFQHSFQHSFHTSFNNLWNNSSSQNFYTIYDAILYHNNWVTDISSKLSHNLWCNTLSQHTFTILQHIFITFISHFIQQSMKQFFITKLLHNLWCNTLSQQLSDRYFIKTSSQQLQEHISTNSSQLHFNKLFNNYSDRSSTNSSIIIVTDLQQTLQ